MIATATHANDASALFAATTRRKLAPPGEYSGRLAASSPFSAKGAAGVDAIIRVADPAYAPRLLTLRFTLAGLPGLASTITRSKTMLEAWQRELGLKGHPSPRDDLSGLFRDLWHAGVDKELIFTVGVEAGENVRTGIRLGDWL
jgi:hypothetical protein